MHVIRALKQRYGNAYLPSRKGGTDDAPNNTICALAKVLPERVSIFNLTPKHKQRAGRQRSRSQNIGTLEKGLPRAKSAGAMKIARQNVSPPQQWCTSNSLAPTL